jgi:hypothetical protein
MKKKYSKLYTSEGTIQVTLVKDLPKQIGDVLLKVHTDFQEIIERRTAKDARNNKKILKQNRRYRTMVMLLILPTLHRGKDLQRLTALDSEEEYSFIEDYFEFLSYLEIEALEQEKTLKGLEKALNALDNDTTR